MKHLGDITKISGATVPPVDVVISSSPCQDLSIAGRRAGLAGERSGLFMEQVRIKKEMREEDVKRGRAGLFLRPRFMVWENVPGAFSSNGGNDFRTILEETIRIAEPDAPDIPLPAKGKWPMADCWMGDGWSVAYRVLDAQFWGVPQRRRRIALVADFGGHAAPEILFVRKGVCGDLAEGETSRKGTAAGTGGGIDGTIWNLQGNAIDRDARMNGIGIGKGAMFTLNTVDRHAVCKVLPFDTTQITWPNCRSHPHYGNPCHTLSAGAHPPTVAIKEAEDHGHQPKAYGKTGMGYWQPGIQTLQAASRPSNVIHDARGNSDGKTACTITGDHQSRVTDYTAIVMATGQGRAEVMTDKSTALTCNHEAPVVAGNGCLTPWDIQSRRIVGEGGVSQTLHSKGKSGGAEGQTIFTGFLRRLTPLECERLQGYPDGWTDIGEWTDSAGKLHKESSDSARYKALGNSIALPPWAWVLKRLCACYERTATMASLFDGIGGFPLLWERLNGPGSCLWASEIEEFPIAVTKRRFGGEES